jgi:EthD domain
MGAPASWKVVVFHSARPEIPRRELLSHWRTRYAERVADLEKTIGLESYTQTVIDRPLAALRSFLVATRSRAALRAIARIGRRTRLLTSGAQPEQQLRDCVVVDQFCFTGGKEAHDRDALAPLRDEWQTWCARSIGLVGENRVSVAPETRSQRVAILALMRRRADASRAEMHDYWRHSHVPLVVSNQRALHFTGYEQIESLPEPAAAAAIDAWIGAAAVASYDGMAALNFRSRRSLLATFFSPRAQRANLALILDELKFLDGPAMDFLVGIETPFPS